MVSYGHRPGRSGKTTRGTRFGAGSVRSRPPVPVVSASDATSIHAARIWRRLVGVGLFVVCAIILFRADGSAAPLHQPTPPATSILATPTAVPTTPAAVPYAVTCTCSSDLFACSSFPFWSAAQACFNQCRIAVGFDIHGLDEDGDGVACELATAGPSPFTLPALPATPTPAATATLTPTVEITPTAPLTATQPVTTTTRAGATITQLPAYAEATVAATDATAGLSHPMTAPVVRLTLSGFVVLVAAGVIAGILRRPRAAPPGDDPPNV